MTKKLLPLILLTFLAGCACQQPAGGEPERGAMCECCKDKKECCCKDKMKKGAMCDKHKKGKK